MILDLVTREVSYNDNRIAVSIMFVCFTVGFLIV